MSVNIWQQYKQKFVAYIFGPPCISIRSTTLTTINIFGLLSRLSTVDKSLHTPHSQ